MAKLAQHMTRKVVIGKLKSYEYKTSPFAMGKGVLDIGKGQQVRFTIFNNENGANPHTKAADFEKQFKEGDLVFITGNDNRSYSAEKDQYYEDTQVWDYREADEDEQFRDVFVYIGDVKEIDGDNVTLSFINYKKNEMLFHLNIEKANIKGELEVGARVKVKGELFSGMKMDFYGDSDGYVTERNVVELEVLHSKEDMEEEEKEQEEDEELWG